MFVQKQPFLTILYEGTGWRICILYKVIWLKVVYNAPLSASSVDASVIDVNRM